MIHAKVDHTNFAIGTREKNKIRDGEENGAKDSSQPDIPAMKSQNAPSQRSEIPIIE